MPTLRTGLALLAALLALAACNPAARRAAQMAARQAAEAAAQKGATPAEQRAAYEAAYSRVMASFEAGQGKPNKGSGPSPKDAWDAAQKGYETPQGQNAVDRVWDRVSSGGNEAPPESPAQR